MLCYSFVLPIARCLGVSIRITVDITEAQPTHYDSVSAFPWLYFVVLTTACTGICIADVVGLLLQSCVYKANNIPGATVSCFGS
jgi:hypothetical protein